MADVVEAMLTGFARASGSRRSPPRRTPATDGRRPRPPSRRPQAVLERAGADQAERRGTGPAGLDLGCGAQPRAGRRHRRQGPACPRHQADAPPAALRGLGAGRAGGDARSLGTQLRLAVSVFMARTYRPRLRLVEEKERFRDRERASTAAQFARLQESRRGPETSGLHLDTVRDLKRIEACWRRRPTRCSSAATCCGQAVWCSFPVLETPDRLSRRTIAVKY